MFTSTVTVTSEWLLLESQMFHLCHVRLPNEPPSSFLRLVEEFMLLANMAAAHHIYREFPDLALLRRHPPPKAKLVEELQELCIQLGIDIDLSSAGALHVSTTCCCFSNQTAQWFPCCVIRFLSSAVLKRV